MQNYIYLAFILVVGFWLLKNKRSKQKSNDQEEHLSSFTLNQTSFKKRYKVMNESELAFYITLKQQIQDQYIILSKVRIEDFVSVNSHHLTFGQHNGLRNRIKSKHVDFLICDLQSRPILAIEVDGGSHKNQKRKDRDTFIDELYLHINLPITHVDVGSSFQKEVEKIKNLLVKFDEKI